MSILSKAARISALCSRDSSRFAGGRDPAGRRTCAHRDHGGAGRAALGRVNTWSRRGGLMGVGAWGLSGGWGGRGIRLRVAVNGHRLLQHWPAVFTGIHLRVPVCRHILSLLLFVCTCLPAFIIIITICVYLFTGLAVLTSTQVTRDSICNPVRKTAFV